MNIRLREIQPEDDAVLFRIYSATRAAEIAMTPWNEEQRQAFLRSQYTAQRDHYRKQFPHAQYDVILFNDEPAGRLYVLREDAGIRVLDIALLPEMQRRGIGTHLLKNLIGEAAQGGKRLRIYVETFNPALSLFEQLGFKPIEDDGVNFLMEYKPAADRADAAIE